jgi:hypothetical protein
VLVPRGCCGGIVLRFSRRWHRLLTLWRSTLAPPGLIMEERPCIDRTRLESTSGRQERPHSGRAPMRLRQPATTAQNPVERAGLVGRDGMRGNPGVPGVKPPGWRQRSTISTARSPSLRRHRLGRTATISLGKYTRDCDLVKTRSPGDPIVAPSLTRISEPIAGDDRKAQRERCGCSRYAKVEVRWMRSLRAQHVVDSVPRRRVIGGKEARRGTRTPNPFITSEVLYQLS